MGKKTRRLVSLGLVVGLLAAGIWYVGQRGLGRTSGPSADGALEASGVIAASEITLSSLHGGTLRADGVYVAEGDAVHAGQIVAALDTTLLDGQIAVAEAQVTVAQAALEQLQAGARPGLIATAAAQLEKARVAQAAAKQNLADAQALRDEPQELDMKIALGVVQVEAAQQRLQSAIALKDAAEVGKKAMDYAQEQVRSWPYPVPAPEIPEALQSAVWDWWKAWVGVNVAQANLDDAKAQLAHWRAVRKAPQELDARVEMAEAAVGQADAAVEAAQAQLTVYQAGASAEQLDVARARVGQAQARLDALRAEREEWTVVAPVSGTVLSRAVHGGEVVAAGSTLLTIADLSRVQLTVYVAENRLGELALKQEVRVTADAFPDHLFAGELTHIADEAQYTPRNIATQEERVNTVYAVEVELANEEGLLKPGMHADAHWGSAEKTAARPVANSGNALAAGLLEASGVVEVDEIRIASERQGAALQVPVHVGDEVTPGQVLVILDSNAVQAGVQGAEAAVQTAEAEVQRVLAQPRAEEVAIQQAQVAMARAELHAADASRRAAARAAEEPQELDGQILTARTQVALAAQNTQLAAAEQAEARSAVDRAEWGSDERQALEAEARAADATLAAARTDERAAQIALRHVQGMRARPLALQARANAAEGAYEVAYGAVAVVQAELDDLQAGATAQERAATTADLALAEAQQKMARAQVERLTLRAPVSGAVIASMLTAGETALTGVTLVTLADLSQVYLTVYVPASRVGEVYLGQGVGVTTDSFPGAFAGQVVHIAAEPQYTPRNVATKEERVNTVYGVKIRLPNPQGLLKPGMAGEARFR